MTKEIQLPISSDFNMTRYEAKAALSKEDFAQWEKDKSLLRGVETMMQYGCDRALDLLADIICSPLYLVEGAELECSNGGSHTLLLTRKETQGDWRSDQEGKSCANCYDIEECIGSFGLCHSSVPVSENNLMSKEDGFHYIAPSLFHVGNGCPGNCVKELWQYPMHTVYIANYSAITMESFAICSLADGVITPINSGQGNQAEARYYLEQIQSINSILHGLGNLTFAYRNWGPMPGNVGNNSTIEGMAIRDIRKNYLEPLKDELVAKYSSIPKDVEDSYIKTLNASSSYLEYSPEYYTDLLSIRLPRNKEEENAMKKAAGDMLSAINKIANNPDGQLVSAEEAEMLAGLQALRKEFSNKAKGEEQAEKIIGYWRVTGTKKELINTVYYRDFDGITQHDYEVLFSAEAKGSSFAGAKGDLKDGVQSAAGNTGINLEAGKLALGVAAFVSETTYEVGDGGVTITTTGRGASAKLDASIKVNEKDGIKASAAVEASAAKGDASIKVWSPSLGSASLTGGLNFGLGGALGFSSKDGSNASASGPVSLGGGLSFDGSDPRKAPAGSLEGDTPEYGLDDYQKTIDMTLDEANGTANEHIDYGK